MSNRLEELSNEITTMQSIIADDLAKPTVKAAAQRTRVNIGKIQKLYKEYRKISLK